MVAADWCDRGPSPRDWAGKGGGRCL